DSQSTDDFAKRRVTRRQRRRIAVYEEELAPVGTRPGVRHGDRALGVLGPRQILIGELVPRAATAGSRGVTALQHVDAGGGEPVAGGVVEVLLDGQVDERVDGARRLVVFQVEDDGAAVGLDRGLVLGALVGRLGRRGADLAGGGAVRGVRAVRGGVRGLGRAGGGGGGGGRGGRWGGGGGAGTRCAAPAAGQGRRARRPPAQPPRTGPLGWSRSPPVGGPGGPAGPPPALTPGGKACAGPLFPPP